MRIMILALLLLPALAVAQHDSSATVFSKKHSFRPMLLDNGHVVLRNAQAPFGRKMLRGGLFVHGFEAISYGLLAVLPTSVSGWGPGTFSQYSENMKRAWTHAPVFDDDHWYINYVGHPYQGTLFYNAVRSQDAKMWQSALFCVGQVFVWEFVIEAGLEQPSIQDIIVTPLAGMILGELVHRGTMGMAHNGFKWYEAVATTIINPMFILNNGYRFGSRNRKPLNR